MKCILADLSRVVYTHARMNTYDDLFFRETILNAGSMKSLADEIGSALLSADSFVLAIDGDSASGKSTLAAALRPVRRRDHTYGRLLPSA